MIERILVFSIERRWLVVLLCAAASAVGAWSLTKLPIDAVPDITNNQVQINMIAPALSPVEVEKQVTFPIETALAGIPGLESTRSFSRNGFAQITAIFTRPHGYLFRAAAGERTPRRSARQACLPAWRSRWARSRPAWAKSIGGRWNICRPDRASRYKMENQAGKPTAVI